MTRCGKLLPKLRVGIVLSFSLLSETFILNADGHVLAAKMASAKSDKGTRHILHQRPDAAELSLVD